MKAQHAVCIYSRFIFFDYQKILKKLQGATRVALKSRGLPTPALEEHPIHCSHLSIQLSNLLGQQKQLSKPLECYVLPEV